MNDGIFVLLHCIEDSSLTTERILMIQLNIIPQEMRGGKTTLFFVLTVSKFKDKLIIYLLLYLNLTRDLLITGKYQMNCG
jgi:hypothetical protein